MENSGKQIYGLEQLQTAIQKQRKFAHENTYKQDGCEVTDCLVFAAGPTIIFSDSHLMSAHSALNRPAVYIGE